MVTEIVVSRRDHRHLVSWPVDLGENQCPGGSAPRGTRCFPRTPARRSAGRRNPQRRVGCCSIRERRGGCCRRLRFALGVCVWPPRHLGSLTAICYTLTAACVKSVADEWSSGSRSYPATPAFTARWSRRDRARTSSRARSTQVPSLHHQSVLLIVNPIVSIVMGTWLLGTIGKRASRALEAPRSHLAHVRRALGACHLAAHHLDRNTGAGCSSAAP